MKRVAFAHVFKNSPVMLATYLCTFRVFDQTFIERKVTKFRTRHTVVEYKIRRRANSTGIRKKGSVLWRDANVPVSKILKNLSHRRSLRFFFIFFSI